MKKLVILLLFISLSGCHLFVKSEKNLPTVITQTEVEYLVPEVNISQNLLQDCRDLEVLPEGSTFTEVLVNTSNNTVHYADCKAKHKSLVEIVKKSLNLKEAE